MNAPRITTYKGFREFVDAHVTGSWQDTDDLAVEFVDDDGRPVDGFSDRPAEVLMQISRVADDGPGVTLTRLAAVPLALILDAATRHASAVTQP